MSHCEHCECDVQIGDVIGVGPRLGMGRTHYSRNAITAILRMRNPSSSTRSSSSSAYESLCHRQLLPVQIASLINGPKTISGVSQTIRLRGRVGDFVCPRTRATAALLSKSGLLTKPASLLTAVQLADVDLLVLMLFRTLGQ